MPLLRFIHYVLVLLLGLLGQGALGQTAPATLPDLNLVREGNVRAIAEQPDGKIFIGGEFTSVNGVPRTNLARLNADGTLDLTWETAIEFREGVNTLLVVGEHLYVGGRFYRIGGVDRDSLARLRLDEGGRVDPAWNVGVEQRRIPGIPGVVSGTVNALAFAGGYLYVGGDFVRVGGVSRQNLARISLTSAQVDRRWSANVTPGGHISCLVADAGWLYVSGDFRAIGGKTRRGLARITLNSGAVDPAWVLKLDAKNFPYIRALSVRGDTVFIGSVGETRARLALPGVAKLTTQPNGTVIPDSNWQPDANALPEAPSAFAWRGEELYVCGEEPYFSDHFRPRIAKLNASTGQAVSGWAPGLSSARSVSALTLLPRGGNLLVAGSFETVNDAVHLSFAQLRGDTGRVDPAFNPQVGQTGDVQALAEQPDGKILVGGDFSFAGTVPRRHLLRLHSDGTLDQTWDPNVNGEVRHIVVAGDAIFIAGEFDRVGSLARMRLAKLSTTKGDEADSTWVANVTGRFAPVITGLAANDTHLYLSGFLEFIDGIARRDVARVSTAGAGDLDVAWAPLSGANFFRPVLALGPDALFVGNGLFERASDVAIVKIGLQGAGEVDPTWRPKFTPSSVYGSVSIRALAVKENALYVGGNFVKSGSFVRGGLAKISTLGTGATDAQWDAGLIVDRSFPASVTSMSLTAGGLAVAGFFRVAGDESVSDVAVVDPDASGTLLASYGVSALLAHAVLGRGNDVFVGGDGERVRGGGYLTPTHRGFLLAAKMLAPTMTIDANDPYTFYLGRNAADGPEVTHFKIGQINGGQLFLADGLTPVAEGAFLTRAEGEAGLKFVAALGSEGAQNVSAQASLNGSASGLGEAATTLALTASTTAAVFELSSGRYTVREQDGSVSLTVLNRNGRAGSVAYALTDETARAGIDFDAAAVGGVLDFAAGQSSRTIVVPITDDTIENGDRSFRVTLSPVAPAPALATRGVQAAAPPLSIVGLRGGAEVVIFDNDFAGGRTGSLLEIAAPDAAPAATGTITLALNPAAPGLWRLVGDLQWRASGATMTGLTRGNFEIEFLPALGFREPLSVPITLLNGTQYTEAVDYAALGPQETGDFTMTLRPNYFATATDPAVRAQWRREGEVVWHDSGEVVAGLPAGVYTIEFKHVDGFSEPTPLLAVVGASQLNTVQGSYRLAETRPGEAPAALTAAETMGRPFEFGGQLQTSRGFGSGFVADSRTVLTAAHVLFDDEALGYVPTVRWIFQKVRDEFEPEPLTPRGWYVFGGYAEQRNTDRGVGGYEADEASPGSRHLDAAALYFFTDTAAPGRGGYGGFLFSDADDNEWLTTVRAKHLAGYPMEGVAASVRGRMHATPELSGALSRVNGRVFRTTEFHGLPGMSGGPLLVAADDATLYPAAIFLHSGGETYVRAIDSDVLGLLNRAQVSASSGGNSTGGGVTVVAPGQTATRFAPCQLRLLLRTATGAVMSAGGWTVEGLRDFQASDATVTVHEPKVYRVTFKPVDGFDTPAPVDVTLSDHQLTTRSAIYYVGYHFALSSRDETQGTVGPNDRTQAATSVATARLGTTASVLARPTSDYAFDHWEEAGVPVSYAARYTFPANRDRTLVALFRAGPFLPFKGEYSGLLDLSTVDDPDTDADGSFTLTLDGKGYFTGALFLRGKRHALRGQFAESGSAIATLATKPPLDVQFLLDLENHTQQITAIVRDGDAELAGGLGDRAIFDGKTLATSTSLAGKYTFALPHPAGAGLPQGDGYGTVVVDPKGLIRVMGKLGDGTAFSAASRLGGTSRAALFVPLYSNRGFLGGRVSFDTTQATTDLTAPLTWVRTAPPDGSIVFDTALNLAGARYALPVFGFTAASFTASGGGLDPAPPALAITIDPARNRGADPLGSRFTLGATPASGLVAGSFLDPAGKPRAFAGAILQKPRVVRGSFKGATGQWGAVELLATP